MSTTRISGLVQRWGWIVVLAVTLAAHGASLAVPFQFDDEVDIAQNQALRDLSSIPEFFTDPYRGSAIGHVFMYRPLLFSSFSLEWAVGGGSVLPFRIVSLLLLFGYALLAGRFVRTLFTRLVPNAPGRVAATAWTTSLLVAAHPLLNESLLMVSSRSSLLLAVFALPALTLLIDSDRSRRATAAIVALTVAAVLTKETAVVLGLLAPLVVWITGDEKPIPRLLRSWPVVVPIAAYVLFYFAMRSGPWSEPPGDVPSSLISSVPLALRPSQGWVALLGLGRLLILPWGLSSVHEIAPADDVLKWASFAFWPLLLGAGLWLARVRGSARQLVGISILWFSLALLPMLLAGLNTPMAEHRVVLAVVVPLAAVAWALTALERDRLVWALKGGLIGLLSLASLLQTLPWRSDLELWAYEVRVSPDSARAHSFLAAAHLNRDDVESARKTIARALKLAPNHAIYLTTAADVEMKSGDLIAAGTYTTRALALEQNYVSLLLLETERRARLGNAAGALPLARRAAELDSRSSHAWNSLGNVLFMTNSPETIGAYQKALDLDPGNEEARTNLNMAKARWPQ